MPKEKRILTEGEIKSLVQNEIKVCFEELSNDVKSLIPLKDDVGEIKQALLGDSKYKRLGLVDKVEKSFEYVKKSEDNKIIDRAGPALRWFEDMSVVDEGESESKLATLGKLITYTRNIKWFLGLIGITTIVNAVPIIVAIVKWLETIKKI